MVPSRTAPAATPEPPIPLSVAQPSVAATSPSSRIALPPAEYKPLPVGTKVTYDTWSYTVAKNDGYTDDFTSFLEKQSKKDFYKKKSVDFSDTKIKRRENNYGYLQYMDKTDSRYRCIIYAERLGAVLGSEFVIGRLCLSTGHREAEKLDQRLFEFVENLRTDGSGKQLTALGGGG